jgi:hypothetical protein
VLVRLCGHPAIAELFFSFLSHLFQVVVTAYLLVWLQS